MIQIHSQDKKPIYFNFVVPDHPWIDQGAAVRIAMTSCRLGTQIGKLYEVIAEPNIGMPEDNAEAIKLNFTTGFILDDLRIGVGITGCSPLLSNLKLCNQGCKLVQRRRKKGEPKSQGFLLSKSEANSIGNTSFSASKIIRPYLTGDEITDKPENMYVIDFYGLSLDEARNRCPLG